MREIAHIVNPVCVDESSSLFKAQGTTFETMRLARKYARDEVDVSLFSAQFAEDHSMVPPWLTKTPDLTRSVLDEAGMTEGKKLPLISDILDRLHSDSAAEYFVYTNVDIALMPYFYVTVSRLIDFGLDAFVVNRRTISDGFSDVNQIPLMFAEIGQPTQVTTVLYFGAMSTQSTSLAPRVLEPKRWGLYCCATWHAMRASSAS